MWRAVMWLRSDPPLKDASTRLQMIQQILDPDETPHVFSRTDEGSEDPAWADVYINVYF